jgi:hypothetical protein
MSLNLNPLAVSGIWQGNYQQAGTSAPTVSSQVASSAVGSNVLNLNWPLAVFVEKLSAADDPQGSVRAGRSGH